MENEFLEVKRLVIEELVSQIDDGDRDEIAREFGLTREKLDDLIVKLVDRWLVNPDHIVMLATVLGIAAPRKSKEGRAHYIG
jgi:hypothetical protein